MPEKDATQRALDARRRVDRDKTRLTEARTKQRTAEDALAAADDAIRDLELDPDRDLERQVVRLVGTIESGLQQIEVHLDEVEGILKGDK
jgi:hypothetical protein